MTLTELEKLHQVIEGIKKIIEYLNPGEQDHFEELTCVNTEDLTVEEIIKVAKENEIIEHVFVQMVVIEDLLPALELYLKSQLVGNPLAKYSTYFSKLEKYS